MPGVIFRFARDRDGYLLTPVADPTYMFRRLAHGAF